MKKLFLALSALLFIGTTYAVTRLPNGNLEITQEEAVNYNRQIDEMQQEIDHWHNAAVELKAALDQKNTETCI